MKERKEGRAHTYPVFMGTHAVTRCTEIPIHMPVDVHIDTHRGGFSGVIVSFTKSPSCGMHGGLLGILT